MLGVELPVSATIRPRLPLYQPHGIVRNPNCTLGSDCHLRHGVTIGNRVDRIGNEVGVASIADHVELGAGWVVTKCKHSQRPAILRCATTPIRPGS